MPALIAKSISILSDAGLGMAMFSLGKYFSQRFLRTHTSTCIYDHHILHALSIFNFKILKLNRDLFFKIKLNST